MESCQGVQTTRTARLESTVLIMRYFLYTLEQIEASCVLDTIDRKCYDGRDQ
jgi:hypothetical protein